ncbi:uncharacterized protein ACO6RY_06199 [Pungitius sinensis]
MLNVSCVCLCVCVSACICVCEAASHYPPVDVLHRQTHSPVFCTQSGWLCLQKRKSDPGSVSAALQSSGSSCSSFSSASGQHLEHGQSPGAYSLCQLLSVPTTLCVADLDTGGDERFPFLGPDITCIGSQTCGPSHPREPE